MDMIANNISPLLIVLVLYVGILCFIGIIAYKSTHNLSDYILGGRGFGVIVTALSTGASDMSGWLLMGLPGAIFAYGLSQSWIAVGLFIGAWINWTYVAGRLRKKTEQLGNAQTLPEYFANRFPEHGQFLRMLSSLVIVIFFTFYCASGVVASARLLELGFGMDYHYAVWIGASMTVIYVVFGGFFAVSWTDTFQAGLMVGALLLVPIMTYLSIDNMPLATDMVLEKTPSFMSFFHGVGVLSLASSLAWGLGYFGQPHILVRFMAAKDSGKTMLQARTVCMIWMGLCVLGALSIGYYGAIYMTEKDIFLAQPENIFLKLSEVLFNPWVSGLLSVAVLSAIMSTLSSQLLIASGCLSRDLLPFVTTRQFTPQQSVRIGRGFLLLVSVVSVLLALNPNSSILNMVGYAWAGFGSSFGSVIILSLLREDITAKGAIAGMITGAVIVLFWEMFKPIELYSMVPAFFTSVIITMMVSRLCRK